MSRRRRRYRQFTGRAQQDDKPGALLAAMYLAKHDLETNRARLREAFDATAELSLAPSWRRLRTLAGVVLDQGSIGPGTVVAIESAIAATKDAPPLMFDAPRVCDERAIAQWQGRADLK